MKNKLFFKLDEVMPVLLSNGTRNLPNYTYQVDLSKDGVELNRIPEWVRKNSRTGNLGESIVWLYLNRDIGKYKALKWMSRESDSCGYDMYAEESSKPCFFEVKTSQHISDNITFFLSINELQTAILYPHNYIIFYVEIDNEKATGTVINNFANKVKAIAQNTVVERNDDLIISYEQLRISILRSSTFELVDLTHELQYVKQLQS